jgi:gamma-glutamyltranspeptidase/glutathione hydrolase
MHAFTISRGHLVTALALFAALAITGCAAPEPVSRAASTATVTSTTSAGTAALPAAPEVSSGYRTGLATTYAARHMAAAANPYAAEAGREMLRRGGSAIDAAVAMQAVLTLVEPQATGIGGGAFLMLWDGNAVHAYDGRETAPAGATETLFLQPDGKPMSFSAGQIGGRSVGIPGVMRALEMAHHDHGRLPWKTLFDPAIRLAEQGFPISARLYTQIAADRFLQQSPAMAAYFLNPDKSPKREGTLLKNPALAAVLRRIADEGAGVLYEGAVAQEIVAQVNGSANPGSMTVSDLKAYVAKERAPICSDYRRFRVCGMPPPSSGGVAIAQILGILQALDQRAGMAPLASFKPVVVANAAGIEAQPEAVHRIAEADRLAYADRGLYVADADFVPVPVAGLIDQAYLANRATQIGGRSMGNAEPGTPAGASIALAPDRSPMRLSTSQVVAVDDFGGAVSMTTTVESYFGAHLMVQGFVLNNQLTDFSFAPSEAGKPVANRVQPGKRPRSSMAPTLVFDRASGALVATLGSPGGSQIIEYVAKVMVGLLDWEMDPQAAVNLPNFGSRNSVTELEKDLASPGLVQALKDRGHRVSELEMTSGVQAIVRVKDANGQPRWAGAADPRREGAALGD